MFSMKRLFVEEWWDERVKAGSQVNLATTDDKALGVDYRGFGPWYRTISIASLYADFQRFKWSHPKAHRLQEDLTCSGFMMIFRSLLPEDGLETLYARITREDGTKIRCRAVRFKDHDYYLRRVMAA